MKNNEIMILRSIGFSSQDAERDISDIRRIETMATTSPIPEAATSALANDKAGSSRDLLVDKLVTIILYERKPVTVWEVAAKLGEGYAEQASVILDGLTAEGVLARFRAGLNNYYAPPKVALTRQEPALGTVISDSLKSLFLSRQYKSMRKV